MVLTGEVTVDQRNEEGEGVCLADISRKHCSGRRTSQCKGSKAWERLAHLEKDGEASVAGVE